MLLTTTKYKNKLVTLFEQAVRNHKNFEAQMTNGAKEVERLRDELLRALGNTEEEHEQE